MLNEKQIMDMGYIDSIIYDEFFVAVGVMTFGKGRIIYADNLDFIENAWCYKSVSQALTAMHEWNPLIDDEPKGWFRNPITGMRRPDGDASLEYYRA